MNDKQQNYRQTPTDTAMLRKRAEEQARSIEPVALTAHTPEELQQILHELQVHQIELNMQNEELRAAQAELEKSRACYFELYDLAPVGYLTVSEQGLITLVNLTAATLLGVKRSALLSAPITRYILKEDQDIYYRHRKILFESGEAQQCELRMIKADSEEFWAKLQATFVPVEDGVPYCRLTLSDITEYKNNEEKIKQHEVVLSAIYENTPLILMLVDSERKVQKINSYGVTFADKAMEDIFGKRGGEALGCLYALEHPEGCGKGHHCAECTVRITVLETIETGQAYHQVEASLPFIVDGVKEQLYFLLSTARLLVNKQQQVLVSMLDITERKKAEETLLESQQTLDALMEYIPIGITITDRLNFRLRRVSRYGLELMGWPKEKHEGLTVEEILSQWEVYKPDGITKADLEELPLIKAISKGEIVFGQELVQIHKDGRAIPLTCDAGPIKNENGIITGGIIAWQDITERKKSEKALHESEQRAKRQRAAIADLFLEDTITAGVIVLAVKKITEVLSSSVKTERVSIWVIDEKSEQLQCLDLYESSTGKHSNGDILHMKSFPNYFDAILKDSRISAANAQEDPRSRELNEGYLKPLGITSLLDAGIVDDGKLKGVVSFEHVGEQRIWHVDEEAFASTIASMVGQLFVDAERKKANEEIRKLNAELENRVKDRTVELEAVNKELESFAYSISHDFRAPLRALNAFSANLTEKYNDQLDEQGLHYLNRIHKASLYMSDLVDDLLKLSRITRTDMNRQKVDISQTAEEIIQGLQEVESERRVKVEVAPGLSAKGDGALMKAALENLIDNAWKFSSKEPQAEIEVGQTVIDGEKIFFVRDNGVGFNMAYADNLFGAFQRLHGVDEFPGTGIGLATVQRIITRHGGRIWAESEVGKGAIFYFTLPT